PYSHSLCSDSVLPFFFFSRPGAPRDLHSFPTRRSSDLLVLTAEAHLDRRAGAGLVRLLGDLRVPDVAEGGAVQLGGQHRAQQVSAIARAAASRVVGGLVENHRAAFGRQGGLNGLLGGA